MSVVNAVEWVPLESSVFTAVAYRAGAQQLYLRFHEGNVYCYLACSSVRVQSVVGSRIEG